MNSGTTGVLCGLIAFLLAGCAATVSKAPRDEYMPGAGYHLMMAEVAAQRGAYVTAAQEYLNAAERSDDAEISQRAAQFAFDYGLDASALRAARRWVQVAPAEPSAHLYLARLLVRRNDVAGAAAETERALGPVGERAAEDYLLLAGELGQEENTDAVTRVFSRLSVQAPESPALRLALGMAALRSRDLDLALESGHAAASGETAAQANMLIARTLLAKGESDAALEHMSRQIEAQPTQEIELEYARLLAAADRPAQAREELDDITDRYGKQPEVTRLRGLIEIDSGDQKLAWEQFSGLLAEGEFPDESFFYMAEIAAKEGQLDQALRFYQRVGAGPYLMPAQGAIARIAEVSGDAESADTYLSQFAERYPQLNFEATRLRATVLQRHGKEEEALQLFTMILHDRPDDTTVLLDRGALLEKMGRLDPALADMRAVVNLQPDSAVALNALGYTLANRTRQQGEAYRLIRRALEREPGSAAILDSYGWVLYRQGRLPEARTYLQLAYSQLPDPEVAAHLGEVMWKQGERELAHKLWQDALEKDPASQSLKDTMARFPK